MFAEDYVTSEQVAQALKVTPQTIRNWIRKGALPAERYGHVFRIRREDFEAFAGTRLDGTAAQTGGDVWSAQSAVLPRRRARRQHSVWDEAEIPVLLRRRG